MSNLEIRLKNIDEIRNSLLDEIEQSDQISSKHEKLYKYLNCIEHMLILVLAVTGCVSISAFASSVCVPVGITSSAIDIKCNHCRKLNVEVNYQQNKEKA